MTEARLVPAETGGLVPEDGGWFVLNAKDARWLDGTLGAYCAWEGREDARFTQVGINVNVLKPGVPMAMYHRESTQEDFLVLDGECLLIVEGEERPLKQWDLFHCPPDVPHTILGAGERPSLVLAVGKRIPDEENDLLYPADPVAQKHDSGVATETSDPKDAYAGMKHEWRAYEPGWLPN
ncbi:MAG TPA: cupin domain-containing protein [Gaiellaceae bacterium]|nr:cupin domain-containing protein [Gaiellaceae bacterium]